MIQATLLRFTRRMDEVASRRDPVFIEVAPHQSREVDPTTIATRHESDAQGGPLAVRLRGLHVQKTDALGPEFDDRLMSLLRGGFLQRPKQFTHDRAGVRDRAARVVVQVPPRGRHFKLFADSVAVQAAITRGLTHVGNIGLLTVLAANVEAPIIIFEFRTGGYRCRAGHLDVLPVGPKRSSGLSDADSLAGRCRGLDLFKPDLHFTDEDVEPVEHAEHMREPRLERVDALLQVAYVGRVRGAINHHLNYKPDVDNADNH